MSAFFCSTYWYIYLCLLQAAIIHWFSFAVGYSMVWIHYNLCVHLVVEGHLGWFKNIATTNIFASFLVQKYNLFLLSTHFGVELTGQISVRSPLITTDKTVGWNNCTNLYSHQQYIWQFRLLCIFTSTCYCQCFYF